MGKNTLPVAQLRRKRKATDLQRSTPDTHDSSDGEEAPAPSLKIGRKQASTAPKNVAVNQAVASSDDEPVAVPATKAEEKSSPKLAPSRVKARPGNEGIHDSDDYTEDEGSHVESGDELAAKSKRKSNAKAKGDAVDTHRTESKVVTLPPVEKPKFVASDLSIFIGGVAWNTTKSVIAQHFKECGDVETLFFPMNREKKSKGYALMTFAERPGFESALRLDGEVCNGRPLKVQRATDQVAKDAVPEKESVKSSKTEREETKKKKKMVSNPEFTAFLTGYKLGTAAECLRKDFGKCGEIARLHMPEGKAHAFIEFRTKEAFDKACEFDETEYFGQKIQIRAANSSSKSKAEGKGSKGSKGSGKGSTGKGKGK